MNTLLTKIALLLIFLLGYSCIKQYDAETVQNLQTFAKIYGYIRYFHPSDEASELDWQKFLVYGVNEVRKVKNQADLLSTLNTLFKPVAPDIVIHNGLSQNLNKGIQENQASGQVEVYWQHRGHGLNGREDGMYQSVRIGRTDISRSPFNFGTVVLKNSNCKDKIIRLSVRARSLLKNDSYAIVFLGTWSNLTRKPDTYAPDTIMYNPEWETFESIDTIRSETDYNWLTIHLIGSGKFEFDDFRIDIRERDGWKPIEINNSSFDDVSNPIPYWDFDTFGYQYEIMRTDNNNYLRIEASPDFIPGSMFVDKPEKGQIISKEVGNGLICDFPISLILDKKPPAEYSESFKNLETSLDIFWNAGKAEEVNARISSVIETWNVFQHFYPYFDLVDTDWEKALTDALNESVGNENTKDQYYTLSRMVAKLHDGHGNVWHRMLRSRRTLPLEVAWIENQVVVTSSDHDNITKGDVVVEVNGVPSAKRLNQIKSLKSGSDQWTTYRAVREFFWGDAGDIMNVVVRRGMEKIQITIKRDSQIKPFRGSSDTIYQVKPGIYYVNLDLVPMLQIENSIDSLIHAKGVIFDLRGYPKGNHDILTYLSKDTLLSAKWAIPRIIYPDMKKVCGFDTSGRWSMIPKEIQIEGKVVFLTDARAISYAESVMGIVEHYKLGEIIGSPTAGTNGNVNSFTTLGGFTINWTGMRVTKHNDTPHHLVGILPTIPMKPTIAGIREDKDELLLKAVEVIRKN